MKLNLFAGICMAGAILSLAGLTGCESARDEIVKALSGNQQYINKETVSTGLKEALTISAGNAVAQTSKAGAYWDNPNLKIPLPQDLQKFADTLRGIGLGSQVDELERKMNEGAEKAAASAGPIFTDAVKNMTISDARGILKGSDTAATDYFRERTYKQLKVLYSPIVNKELDQVGAVKLYNELYQKYSLVPLVPKLNVKLEDYVTEKALNGLFSVVAGEEKKIRQDPAARTTDLLKKVFAQQ